MYLPVPANKFRFRLIFLLLLFFFLQSPGASAQFRDKYQVADPNEEITGMSFISSTTGFVAFSRSIGFTTDSGQTYIRRTVNLQNVNYNNFPVNLTFGFYVSGVHAFSSDSLLVYGDYAAEPSILFSADQGLTWKVVFHRQLGSMIDVSNTIVDLKFPGNGNIGYALHHEQILKTQNRGQSWTVVQNILNLDKFSFPSSTVGYVLAGSKVLKISGGGLSWRTLNLPVGNAQAIHFESVFFQSQNVGYVTERREGKIYRTLNGGDTWTKMNDETVVPISGSDLHFTNDSTANITGGIEGLSKTTDSGRTWEPVIPAHTEQFYGLERLHFITKDIGWAAGAKSLLITTNGGGPTYPKAYFKADLGNLCNS